MKIFISSLFLTFNFSLLFAQGIPYNQEFQVNTYAESNQNGSSVSTLSQGGFIICWESHGQDGSGSGIYGQVYNENGSKHGIEFQVNTKTEGYQRSPRICRLSEGGFVVCWNSFLDDWSSYGIYGQVYNEDGSKRGSEFQVNTDTHVNQGDACISRLTEGGFIVCWTSNGNDGSGSGIYGQIYNEDGSKRGSAFLVNSYTNDSQFSPSISRLTEGGFIVCWVSRDQDGSGLGIYGQVFNEDGSKRGPEFQVNTYTQYYQTLPKVSRLTEGGFIISWMSYFIGVASYEIYAQVYNEDGSKRGFEFQVNTYTNYDQGYPSLTRITEGGFIVCWSSIRQDGSGSGIYGQVYNENGSKHGIEFRINTYTYNYQDSPSITWLTEGGFIVCWTSDGQDGSGRGIYAKYYTKERVHSLESFSLLQPKYDQTILATNPLLKWQQANTTRINLPWELRYALYLDENDAFSSPTAIDSLYDTTYTIQNLNPGTTYSWKVLAKNIAGDSLWSTEIIAFFVDWDATTLADEQIVDQPKDFKLCQNHPNPFNPTTTISYQILNNSAVILKVYDISGRKVATLIDEKQNAGKYSVKFEASGLASGVYIYQLNTSAFISTRKMILLR